MTIFEQILRERGLMSPELRRDFLSPDYAGVKHDPFLLPDMNKAVERLKKARQKQEKIVIYGDYDIDGLSATALLLDAFGSFGFEQVEAFIPNRFVEGYGMTKGAVDKVKAMGAELIVTVDCGSLCHAEIAYASELGIDTVVTDHHNVAETLPPAVAVVNPKSLLQDYSEFYEGLSLRLPLPLHSSASHPSSRASSSPIDLADVLDEPMAENHIPRGRRSTSSKLYPFLDLAGVGVAFKLVQALQTELEGLPAGQEKWLLDLVALGTVCDVVTLVDENRANVFWGLEVLKKGRRTGLRALMSVADIKPETVNARSLGFGLGPRMNASGRLDTARHSLDMLTATNRMEAFEASEKLEMFNQERRSIQDRIFAEAVKQADKMLDDQVLVVSAPDWNHGVIGIVASKLVETYKKPTFIIAERQGEATGSARSFGDFSVADAVRAADDLILRGGGHSAAAGVTLLIENIPAFRARVNRFYESLKLKGQEKYLLPSADVELDSFAGVDEQLIADIASLEPFGNGNLEPVLRVNGTTVVATRQMGTDGQHLKLTLRGARDQTLQVLAFNAPEEFFREVGDKVNVWFQPSLNDWNGTRSVEGRLLHLEVA